MSYLDMILDEAVASTNNTGVDTGVFEGRRARDWHTRGARTAAERDARLRDKAELRQLKKSGTSHFAIQSSKTSAIEVHNSKIQSIKSEMKKCIGRNGEIINPRRYAALQAQLDAEKAAMSKLIKASKGKSKSSNFSYSKDKKTYNLKDYEVGDADGRLHERSRARESYNEGYEDALYELGYYDEDYDYDDYDDYDEYDDDEAVQSYLEGYYLAMIENGYDID